MGSLIDTPKNVPGAFKPAVQPQSAAMAAPVTATPQRFETTPETRYPLIPSKEQLLMSPNSVPLDLFHKVVGRDATLADKMAPGIAGPQGYLLLQPDSATGAPLVKLKDPIAFAALANKAGRKAQMQLDGIQTRELGLDPIQSRQVTLDPLDATGGSVGDPEIVASGVPQTQAEMLRGPNNPVPNTVDSGGVGTGSASPTPPTPSFASTVQSIGAKGLKKLAQLVEEKGAEEATKLFFSKGYNVGESVAMADDGEGSNK